MSDQDKFKKPMKHRYMLNMQFYQNVLLRMSKSKGKSVEDASYEETLERINRKTKHKKKEITKKRLP